MLGCPDSMDISRMYAHVNKHILSTNKILLAKVEELFNIKMEKPYKYSIAKWYITVTFMVAARGSFGNPFAEFESIDRNT